MAFNTQTFLTRLGSAAIFSAIMLLGLLMNEWAFIALFFTVNLLCLREYSLLVEKILRTTFSRNEKFNFVVLGMTLFALVCALPLLTCDNSVSKILNANLYYFVGLVIGTFLIFFLFKKNKKAIFLLTGLGYIPLAFGFLVQVRFQSIVLPIMLIFFIWMNDSMAYLTGSFIGKTPFAPTISPKKTLEGTIGGIIFTMVFAFIWGHYTNWFPISVWLLFGAIAGIIGTIGDLIESKLKRLADVKDSGNIMPGHGGALDRFDSLLLAAPFAFFVSIVFQLCLQMKVL